jgi:hypothetical protein
MLTHRMAAMHRRQFLASSLAASALTLAGEANAQAPKSTPQYYELRKYRLQSGPQTKLTQSYFADALIPALNRMGITPVGAFSLDFGPETPTYYLLLPSTSVEALVTADLNLAKDAAFMKAAEPYWNVAAGSPGFVRIESQLMRAFPGWPTLTPPDAKAKRLFQLRTYESPTYRDHVVKVDMFHHGEFDFFAKSGAHQVFYGDNLIGSRLPSLTYMLSFPDTATLEKDWAAFSADPDWKKLASDPKYAFEPTVSSIDNLILKPLPCSQI